MNPLRFTIEVTAEAGATVAVLMRGARRIARALPPNVQRTLYALTDYIEMGEGVWPANSGVPFSDRKRAALELCDHDGRVTIATFSTHQRIERNYAAQILRRLCRLHVLAPFERDGEVVPLAYVRADESVLAREARSA